MNIETYASIAQNNFDKIWAILEENSKQLKESKKQFSEIGERFRETDRMLSEKFKETDRMLSEKFKETDAKIKETSKQIGKLTHSWGEFVEGIVLPSVIGMFAKRNIEIKRVYQRPESHKDGETMEMDILGVNSLYSIVIEAKSKFLVPEVEKFIEKLNRFKEFFPEHIDKKVLGGIAGITIDESVSNFAKKQGLFVIVQKGEIVEIINEPDFQPNFW